MIYDIWARFSRYRPNEAARIRHCRGCRYLGTVAGYGCCNYYLETGNRRPSKFGTPCSVKEIIKGFVMPKSHAEYVNRIDMEEEERRKQSEFAAEMRLKRLNERNAKIEAMLMQAENDPENEITRKRGRRLTWDSDYAFDLFCEGFRLFEISKVMDVPMKNLTQYASYHNWRGQCEYVKYIRHDIKQAREYYLAYLLKKEAANRAE